MVATRPVADVALIRQHLPPVPAAMARAGVTTEQWNGWFDQIHEAQEAGDAFSNCKCVGMTYWCCPLLCFQPCICIANPCTWKIMLQHAKAKESIEDKIRAESPDGMHFRVTMMQHAVWETNTIFELRLQQAGFHALPPPTELPVQLGKLGATQEQWTKWVDLINKERKAHLFSSLKETWWPQFCYAFFPLGVFQPCLCLLNPLQIHNGLAVHRARFAAEEEINRDLAPLNAHFVFERTERSVLFVRGPLPPHLAKRSKRKGLAMLSVAMPGGGAGGGIPGMTSRRGEPEAWEAPEHAVTRPPVRV